MNSTVERIRDYILSEYGIEFKLVHYPGNRAERWLEYKKDKKEYTLSCGYAQSNREDPYNEYWSIFEDYMDYEKWHGSGSAIVDEGIKTVDKIMNDWGFKKDMQMRLF